MYICKFNFLCSSFLVQNHSALIFQLLTDRWEWIIISLGMVNIKSTPKAYLVPWSSQTTITLEIWSQILLVGAKMIRRSGMFQRLVLLNDWSWRIQFKMIMKKQVTPLFNISIWLRVFKLRVIRQRIFVDFHTCLNHTYVSNKSPFM